MRVRPFYWYELVSADEGETEVEPDVEESRECASYVHDCNFLD